MEIVLLLSLLRLLNKKSGVGAPFTLEELSRSSAAKELGIDNSIPASLRTRALGLGVVAGVLRAAGFRMTSLYRSQALTVAIRLRNAASNVNQSVIVDDGPGSHPRACGIDVAPAAGPSRDKAVLKALQQDALKSAVGPLIVQALVEDDHVHLTFRESDLDELGRQRIAKEQGNV